MITAEIVERDDHFEVRLMQDGNINSCFTFDTKAEVNAFWQGYNATKSLINGLVQSLPLFIKTIKK